MELPSDIEHGSTSYGTYNIYRKHFDDGRESFCFVIHRALPHNSTAAWVTDAQGGILSFKNEDVERLKERFGVGPLCESYISRRDGRLFLHQMDAINEGYVLWLISKYHGENPYDEERAYKMFEEAIKNETPHEELLVMFRKLRERFH